jgi:hypothetical protein
MLILDGQIQASLSQTTQLGAAYGLNHSRISGHLLNNTYRYPSKFALGVLGESGIF